MREGTVARAACATALLIVGAAPAFSGDLLGVPGADRADRILTGYLGGRSLVAEAPDLECAAPAAVPDTEHWCGGIVLRDQGRTLYWLDPRRDRIERADLAGDGLAGPLPLERPLRGASMLSSGPDEGPLWCMEGDGTSLAEIAIAGGKIRTLAPRASGTWASFAAPEGDGPAAAFDAVSGALCLVSQDGSQRRLSGFQDFASARGAFFRGKDLFVYLAGSRQLVRVDLNGGPALAWPASGTAAAAVTFRPVTGFASADWVWPGVDKDGRGLAFGWDSTRNCVIWHGLEQPEDGTLAMDRALPMTATSAVDPYFRANVALAFDGSRGMVYAADPVGAGVLGLEVARDARVIGEGGSSLGGAPLEYQPPWGASRTLVVGTSIAGVVEGTPDSLWPFTRLMAPLYNAERARRGWSGRMQPTVLWEAGSAGPDGAFGLALAVAAGMPAARISRVLVVVTSQEPIDEAFSYLHFPVPDDVGDRNPDPEWSLETLPEMREKLGPKTRALIKVLQEHAKENGDIYTLRADGQPVLAGWGPWYRLYDEPAVAAALMARYAAVVEKVKKDLDGRNITLECVIIPTRNQVGPQELTGGGSLGWDRREDWAPGKVLRAFFEREGIPTIDLSRELQALDPMYRPAYQFWHFNQDGQWMVAEAMAQSLNDLDGPNPAWRVAKPAP